MIIRINSQSGKGGIAYILERECGLDLPKTMHPTVGSVIYGIADEQGRELEADEIRDAFYENFVNIESCIRTFPGHFCAKFTQHRPGF